MDDKPNLLDEVVDLERERDELFAVIESPTWLIWSNEHRAWWRPDCRGYTHRVEEAGRYTFEDALSKCGPMTRPGMIPDEMIQPSPEWVAMRRDAIEEHARLVTT